MNKKFLLIASAVIISMLGIFLKCSKEKVDIGNYDAVVKCSDSLLKQYGSTPDLLYKVMYGEYSVNDSVRVQINPNGVYFLMNRVPGNLWEIKENGVSSLVVRNDSLIFTTTLPCPIQDAIHICDDVIWDSDYKVGFYRNCKCTL